MPKLRLSRLQRPARDQASRGAVLVIRPTKRASPSDTQAEFNRLSWRISVLRRKVATEHARLTELLNRFLDVVVPVETDLARNEIELAKALSAAHGRWPLRKQQTEDVRHLILRLLAGAFAVDDPDDAAIALHDEWSGRNYRDDVRRSLAAIKKSLREDFRTEFGVEADDADDGDDSVNGFRRFRSVMAERIQKAQKERTAGARKKSRDLGKQQRRTDQESVRLRSIRSIYLSLAKVLHPDAQSHSHAEREQDMKLATDAYRKQDLLALLQLEQRWGTRDEHQLANLDDRVVAIYVATLRQYEKSLESELRRQRDDPAFAEIAPILKLTRSRAIAGIDARADELRGEQRRVQELLADLGRCRGKQDLARLVGDFLDRDDRMINLAIE